MGYAPIRYTPSEVHAYEGFYENLACQNKVARLFQRQLGFWCRHMGLSHRRIVLRPLYRTLHDLLRYQRSLALLRPVCLQSVCPSDLLANPIACASFTRLILPLL
jgi:hypothetical protein